ncbi:MAG: hypothetical protein GY719_31025 [bacterium]|nr:hypothetical protein [bacterium]
MAVAASGEEPSPNTAEQVSYRIARDSPDDPTRLELLDAERVVYEYTPDSRPMFLIEAESVRVPEYGRPVLVTVWQMGVQSQLLVLIDPQQLDPKKPEAPLLLEQWSMAEIHYEVEQGKLAIDYEIINPETGDYTDRLVETMTWPE